MSFLTPQTPGLAHRGLGFFEIIGALVNTGVSAYLEKERQRREQLAADRAARLEQQRVAAIAEQQRADAAALADMGFSARAQQAASSPAALVAVGAAGLGILWLLSRR